jgi:arsenate reductase (thioredoxin)
MKKRLLFVCIGNACRSIMAEALLNHKWAERYETASAGMSPLGRVPENTLLVLQEAGIVTNDLRSKGIWEFDLNRFDFLINLSEYPVEGFIASRFEARVVNWYVRDPYGSDIEAYRSTRDTIEWVVVHKIPELVKER